MKGKISLAVIFVAPFLFGSGVEYSDYEAFRLFDFGIGARAIGMGNAVVVSSNDAYAIYWNPARLPLIEKTTLVTSISYLYNPLSTTGKPFARFTKPQIALSYSLGSYSSVGLAGFHLNYDDDVKYMYQYEIDTVAPTPGYNENILSLGFGNEIIKGFNLGVALFLHQLSPPNDKILPDTSEQGFSISFGSYYLVTPQISLGLLYNSGTTLFPGTWSKTDTFEISVPARAIFGVAYRPIDCLLLELDIKTNKNINPFKLYLGGEYCYYFLKKGYENGPLSLKARYGIRDLLGEEDFGQQKIRNHAFSAGVGFIYNVQFIKATIDYALMYRPNVKYIIHFSHTLSFGLGVIY